MLCRRLQRSPPFHSRVQKALRHVPFTVQAELLIMRKPKIILNFAATLEGDAENLAGNNDEPITCSPRTG